VLDVVDVVVEVVVDSVVEVVVDVVVEVVVDSVVEVVVDVVVVLVDEVVVVVEGAVVVVAAVFTAGVQKNRAFSRVSVRVPNWSLTSVLGGADPRHLIL
jgi:hypothetical protein